MKRNRLNEPRQDQVFNLVNVIIISLFSISILYPLIFIVSASFSSPQAIISGKIWLWPVDVTLDGYRTVFKDDRILQGLGNSLFYTIVGTAVNVALTVMAAYPLARRDFVGRNIIMMLFAFTMLFSGGLIPHYLLIKDLGLLNTRWSLIIPGALAVWNMIIMRTYFQETIPHELLEAAQIDGCSDLRFVRSMVLPLSGPIIAVVSLFYAVNHWNEYFNALIYLKDQKLYPVQLILREILIENQMSNDMMGDVTNQAKLQNLSELLRYSLIVIASLPVLAIYPFVQKYFVKGIMIGSLKE